VLIRSRRVRIAVVSIGLLGSIAVPANASAQVDQPLAPCEGSEIQFWYQPSDSDLFAWEAYVKNCSRTSVRRAIEVTLAKDGECKTVPPGKTYQWNILVRSKGLQHPVREYPC
jgi:hypothetical protein